MVDHGPVSRSMWRRIGEWLLILGTGTLAGALMFDSGGPVVAVMAGITAAAATFAFVG
jgi:hypothetical protein